MGSCDEPLFSGVGAGRQGEPTEWAPAKELLEGEGPNPVDRELLRRYHQGEISGLVAEAITESVAMFRGWADAYREVLKEVAEDQDRHE